MCVHYYQLPDLPNLLIPRCDLTQATLHRGSSLCGVVPHPLPTPTTLNVSTLGLTLIAVMPICFMDPIRQHDHRLDGADEHEKICTMSGLGQGTQEVIWPLLSGHALVSTWLDVTAPFHVV